MHSAPWDPEDGWKLDNMKIVVTCCYYTQHSKDVKYLANAGIEH